MAAIRAQGGNSADVTGAILIAGLILAAVGVVVHFGGSRYVRAVLPPAVTGAVVVIPSVIALLAENSGHVKAVPEMTGEDLDPYLGRAFTGDGIGTAMASAVGGSPTTRYAENIGVMAATRIYSTLAYYIAAMVAILFGFCPKFGAVVAATLGGITLVLYGMIGLLGAKIWIENRVDFADPVNLVPLAAGITAGIGNLTIKVTSTFSISGIAAGTLMVIIGYHAVRPFARRPPDEPQPSGAAGQLQARVTGRPAVAEDDAVRSPDEDTGGTPDLS